MTLLIRSTSEKNNYFTILNKANFQGTVYILGQYSLSYTIFSFGLFNISSWLVWTEIQCLVHTALPKRPINQFKTSSEMQTIGANSLLSYNIYTVDCGVRD